MPEWITPLLWPVWCVATPDSFSSTTTPSLGRRVSKRYAVASPTMPAPTMTTSALPLNAIGCSLTSQRNAVRRRLQVRGLERVRVPLQVGREPFQHPKPALAGLALEPARRYLIDAPAQPVRLHEQLDAVGEPDRRLDLDAVEQAPRKQPESVARVVRRQLAEVMQREGARAHQDGLQPRATDHRAAGHEAARADDVRAVLGDLAHTLEGIRVVVVVCR